MVREPYRWVVRIHLIAEAHWPQIETYFYQVDLWSLPVVKFLNLIHGWVLANTDPKKLEEWQFEMEKPFPWEAVKPPTPEQAADDLAQFMSAAAELNQ